MREIPHRKRATRPQLAVKPASRALPEWIANSRACSVVVILGSRTHRGRLPTCGPSQPPAFSCKVEDHEAPALDHGDRVAAAGGGSCRRTALDARVAGPERRCRCL